MVAKRSRTRGKGETAESAVLRKRAEEHDPDVATTDKELASRLGVTTRTVRNWKRSGLPRNADGTYTVPLVAAWHREQEVRRGLETARKRAEKPGRKPSTEPTDADLASDADVLWSEEYWKTYERKYRALVAELRFLEEQGDLVRVDLVRRLWRRALVITRNQVETIPEKVLLLLPAEIRTDLRPELRKEAHAILAEFQDVLAELEIEETEEAEEASP